MPLAARLRAVPALAFVAQQLQEELHGVFFFVEMMLYRLATRADAPPSAGQANVSKQGRLD